VPDIDIAEYLMRLAYYIPLTKQQLLLGVEYIDRYLISSNTFLSTTSMHRLTATAMVLAHKFDCDYPLKDACYGKIMGLKRNELMVLQMEFMRRVQYRLMYPDVLRDFSHWEGV
jgi:phosphate system cyclin PHO80